VIIRYNYLNKNIIGVAFLFRNSAQGTREISDMWRGIDLIMKMPPVTQEGFT
jgi:hypothetical protein